MGCGAKFSGALPGCVADTVSSIIPNRATRDNRIRNCVNSPLKKPTSECLLFVFLLWERLDISSMKITKHLL